MEPTKSYSFGAASQKALVGVHPDLVKVLTTAITNSPIDFSINEGVRSLATQQKYYTWGRTVINPNTGPLPGKPFGDTNTNADGVVHKSNHQKKADGYGHAVDLYPYINGKIDFGAGATLVTIANHIKKVAETLEIAITWGGDWKPPIAPVDKPHFQLKQ